MNPLVLLCPDVAGTPPFHGICQQLIKELAHSYRFQIIPFRDVRRGACDILVGLWWQGCAIARANVKPKSVITCVYDTLSYNIDPASRQMFRLTLKNSSVVGVANEEIGEDIKRLFPDCPPIHVIEDGVDLDMFSMQPMPENVRAGWTGNSGRHTPGGPKDHKGLQIIRRACWKAGMPLSILDSASGGAWPLDRMSEFYNEISVYICASVGEGTPNPLLEALACGRPVITTRVGLAEKLITEGVNGWFIERSVEDLTRVLLMVRGLPRERLIEMGQAARVSVAKQSWTERCKSWNNALREAQFRPIEDRDTRPPVTGKRIKHVIPKIAQKSWTTEEMCKMVEDVKGRKDLERFEVAGKAVPYNVVDRAIAVAEEKKNVGDGRPLVAVPSRWRFLSRTMKILEQLVDEFKFYCPKVFGLGDDPPADKATAAAMTFYPFADGTWCGRKKASNGIPYIATIRGRFWDTPELPNDGFGVYTMTNASQLVSLTRTLANEMFQLYPQLAHHKETLRVIPNGGYPEMMGAPIGERPEGVEGFVPDATRPLILMMTNLRFRPKADAALRMLDQVERYEGFPGTVILLGHEGPYSPAKGWLGKSTVYIGYVDDPSELLRTADGFIYLSDQDSQPTAVMEALSCGLPTAVGRTERSGAHEFIDDGVTGIVFDNEEGGLRRLIKVLTTGDKGRELGMRGYRSIVEKYSWEAAAKQYGALLRKIIKESQQ